MEKLNYFFCQQRKLFVTSLKQKKEILKDLVCKGLAGFYGFWLHDVQSKCGQSYKGLAAVGKVTH